MSSSTLAIDIGRVRSPHRDWAALRAELWPDMTAHAHQQELAELLGRAPPLAGFIARVAGKPVGFAEASLRSDYVNGCETRQVVFLEGIWVHPDFRRRGIARALVQAVEEWGIQHGRLELASDALLDNAESHAMHRRLGFEETERVVFFRKRLRT